jgi:broad specificity phosphatase PhoE
VAGWRFEVRSLLSIRKTAWSTLVLYVLFGGFLVAVAPPASAEKTVLLVRHAEKQDESDDADLSEAGVQRAERLGTILQYSGITHIITSDRQRTLKTARPLLLRPGVKPIVVEKGASSEVVNKIRSVPEGAVILVVGHSSTLPSIQRAIGKGSAGEFLDHGDLFIGVIGAPAGPPVFLRLRY